MACTRSANDLQHQLHLDITENDDSFNTTVMINPNPNTTTSLPQRPASIAPSSLTPSPFYSFIHSSTHLPPFNHHLAVASNEQSRTEFMEQPLGSSRWNPTPEQLLALEEMYRRGMRTPSAEQIQLIAAQLRRFGKIEGKNVFYWFQNHKARERQKRRRELLETTTTDHHHPEEKDQQHQHHHETTDLEKKDSGMRKGTIYDVEQTKNWTSSSSNWSKHSEEFVSMHTSVAETGPHGWPQQFDDTEIQLQRNFNFNFNLNLPHFKPPTSSSNYHHHHLYFPQSFSIAENNQNDGVQETTTSATTTTTTRTLELFPLHSDEYEASKKDHNDDDNDNNNMKMNITATINNNSSSFSPKQYIEFLPLKN